METLKNLIFQYRTQILISCLVIVILSFSTCSHDYQKKLEGQYSILKLELAKEKQKITDFEVIRVKQRDSLNKEIYLRDIHNRQLNSENNNLEAKISEIRDKPVIIPKDLEEMAYYFNSNYFETENKVLNDMVCLNFETSSSVITDLQYGRKCEGIVHLKTEQLKNKDSIISNLNIDKENLLVLNSAAEKQIKQKNELQIISDTNIKNLETQVKIQNRKNIFNKIISISAILGAGVLGNQLAK